MSRRDDRYYARLERERLAKTLRAEAFRLVKDQIMEDIRKVKAGEMTLAEAQRRSRALKTEALGKLQARHGGEGEGQ